MAVVSRLGECRVNAVLVILILLGITIGICVAHHDGYLVGKEHGFSEGRKLGISKQQSRKNSSQDSHA